MTESDGKKAVIALDLAAEGPLTERQEAYFAKCEEKLGMIPNVLKAYAFSPVKLQAFADMYNDLMLGDSALSKLEREMIAVVVSSVNRCYYCLTAHGAAVRQLSGDPELGEMLVMNYRVAELSERHRAMLDFAWKLTATPWEVEEPDRQKLRDAGFQYLGVGRGFDGGPNGAPAAASGGSKAKASKKAGKAKKKGGAA